MAVTLTIEKVPAGAYLAQEPLKCPNCKKAISSKQQEACQQTNQDLVLLTTDQTSRFYHVTCVNDELSKYATNCYSKIANYFPYLFCFSASLYLLKQAVAAVWTNKNSLVLLPSLLMALSFVRIVCCYLNRLVRIKKSLIDTNQTFYNLGTIYSIEKNQKIPRYNENDLYVKDALGEIEDCTTLETLVKADGTVLEKAAICEAHGRRYVYSLKGLEDLLSANPDALLPNREGPFQLSNPLKPSYLKYCWEIFRDFGTVLFWLIPTLDMVKTVQNKDAQTQSDSLLKRTIIIVILTKFIFKACSRTTPLIRKIHFTNPPLIPIKAAYQLDSNAPLV